MHASSPAPSGSRCSTTPGWRARVPTTDWARSQRSPPREADTPAEQLRGWVLAGGQSRRFGSDKALYRLDGEPLALRIARTLAAAGLDPWLVARTDRGLAVPTLIEPDGPRHPLHGVATALAASAALGHRNALVCPCDLADLTVLQVATLLARGGPAVAIGQPLLAVFPVTWASTAARLARAGAPVRSFVAELPTVDLGPIRNLNEPPGPPASG